MLDGEIWRQEARQIGTADAADIERRALQGAQQRLLSVHRRS
jgi:hypothetical protein